MADDDDKRNGESKANNWLWYLVLTAIILISIGIFAVNNAVLRLSYPDFVKLLRETKYVDSTSRKLEEGFSGQITVTSSTDPKNKVELSNIHSVRVDKSFVSGYVMRRNLSPGANSETAVKVEFRASKDDSEKTNAEIRDLLSASNVDWGFTDGPNFMSQYGPVLLMIAAAFFIMMFAARKIGGVGSPMSFGRSRGRLYAQDDIGITFDDIAGVDEAVEEVREIVDFLKYPEKYQRLGGRIPKGVLLVGPPGTGKTLLAKAIAGEAGVPFFSLSGSDFVEMFVGVGAARVRDMFQQAAAKSPSIIFIDELDALGKSRSNSVVGVHDEREQTLNALLVEMDGFDPNTGIIVIAATNRPETLDSALLRPGRFDRNVLVDRPDKSGREEILKVHVKNVKLGPDVRLKEIASITSGFCGADLANLVNEAALLAARKGKSTVGQQEFDEGVERVTTGLEKKRRVMQDDEKRRVAFHEAAHALVAYSLPNTDPVHKVSIIPRGLAALGYTLQRPEDERFLDDAIRTRIADASPARWNACRGDDFPRHQHRAQNDLERASAIARSMVMEFGMSRLGRVNYRESGRSPFLNSGRGEAFSRDHSEQTAREIDEEVKRIIDDMSQRARQVLAERRQALENITQRLIEVEIIDNTELSRLVDETLPGPRVVPGTQIMQGGSSGIRTAPPVSKTDEDLQGLSGEAAG